MAQEPFVLDQPAIQRDASPRQLTLTELALRRLWRRRMGIAGAFILLLIVALAVCAPILTPENPYDVSTWNALNQGLSPRLVPAWYFILGTDPNGHLVLSQIAWGARVSLSVALAGTLGAVVIGIPIGAVAGYVGGWLDTLLMRVTDVFLIVPFVPVVLFAASLFGARDAWAIGRILIVFSWPMMARMARVVYLGLRGQDYALAARAQGIRHHAIIVRHLLPNALGPLVATTTLITATCITTEAVIDFFGFGVQYPDVSWGTILLAAFTALNWQQWWWPVFPAVALALTVLAVHLLGTGIDDALDVRSSAV